MVQFLSIFFFLDFFNFCCVFQKFSFFCVTLYKKMLQSVLVFGSETWALNEMSMNRLDTGRGI
jgi:hypothetical protein